MKHARRRLAHRTNQFLDTVVIVPARNEESDIYLSLRSLAEQSCPPSLIVVVVNNSTDRTLEYARQFKHSPGVPRTELVNLPNNPHKKAGALNAGINWLQWATNRKLADAARHLLVLDADSELHPEFIARAKRVMERDLGLGGVSAACQGRRVPSENLWQRFITGMQKIEYGRYSSARFRKNVMTMSGAGSFYRTEALQGILDWRGQVFMEHRDNLVEDYETTLALKESGWRVTANEQCIAYTDLMSSLGELITQRQRWVRGGVTIIRQRGVTKHTWQSYASLAISLLAAGWILFWSSTVAIQGVTFHAWWSVALFAFWPLYAAFTVKNLGWRAMLVEALIVPEVLYNLVRTYWLVTSVIKSFSSRAAAWVE